jgi:Rrf2 family protein
MISLTGEYALRAMIFLTKHADAWPISGSRIAEEAEIPRKYLSAILADLVRAGLLEGMRGKGGGFRMARPPKEVRLVEVLAPFEPILANRRPCPFGNVTCHDQDPCAGHERWKRVREAYQQFLQDTSVYDVAVRQAEAGNGRMKKRTKR